MTLNTGLPSIMPTLTHCLRLPRKTVEEPDDWSIKADQVDRVQMERAAITVSQIREATRGDPVLSRAMYFILHGWPAEHCISDELNLLQ